MPPPRRPTLPPDDGGYPAVTSSYPTPVPATASDNERIRVAEKIAELAGRLEMRPSFEQVRAEVSGARRSISADIIKLEERVDLVGPEIDKRLSGLSDAAATKEAVENLKAEVIRNRPPNFWVVVGAVFTLMSGATGITWSASERASELRHQVEILQIKQSTLEANLARVEAETKTAAVRLEAVLMRAGVSQP